MTTLTGSRHLDGGQGLGQVARLEGGLLHVGPEPDRDQRVRLPARHDPTKPSSRRLTVDGQRRRHAVEGMPVAAASSTARRAPGCARPRARRPR